MQMEAYKLVMLKEHASREKEFISLFDGVTRLAERPI